MVELIHPQQLQHILNSLARARGRDPVYHQALKDVALLFDLEFGPPFETFDVSYTVSDGRERIPDELQEL